MGFLLVFQSLRDVDYVVKDKTLLESIMDTEFFDATEKGIFYKGMCNYSNFAHYDSNKVRVGRLCCPGMVLASIRETSSLFAYQGMLVSSCLGSLSHCGLILN